MVKWSERYAGKWLPPPRLTSEPNRPLTRADCYEALQSTINKARSIEEEIAKSKLSLFTRIWHSPRGGSSEFDVLLSSTHNQIPPVLEIEVPKLGDERPEHLLSELLDVDKDFLDSSARLKGSILRAEKNFGQNVVEPLKRALINKSIPDYLILMGHTTDCQQEIMTSLELWREEVQGVFRQIMATETWHKDIELNKEIDELLRQAKEAGWDFDNDDEWKRLGLPFGSTRNRIHGMNKYLKRVVKGKSKFVAEFIRNAHAKVQIAEKDEADIVHTRGHTRKPRERHQVERPGSKSMLKPVDL